MENILSYLNEQMVHILRVSKQYYLVYEGYVYDYLGSVFGVTEYYGASSKMYMLFGGASIYENYFDNVISPQILTKSDYVFYAWNVQHRALEEMVPIYRYEMLSVQVPCQAIKYNDIRVSHPGKIIYYLAFFRDKKIYYVKYYHNNLEIYMCDNFRYRVHYDYETNNFIMNMYLCDRPKKLVEAYNMLDVINRMTRYVEISNLPAELKLGYLKSVSEIKNLECRNY